METTTINLIDNRQQTIDGPASIDLLITHDINDTPVGTLFVDGIPVIWASFDNVYSSDRFEWTWIDFDRHGHEALATAHMDTVEYLLYSLGEVTDDGHARWQSAIGTVDQAVVHASVTGYMASEGHGMLGLIDQIEAALTAALP